MIEVFQISSSAKPTLEEIFNTCINCDYDVVITSDTPSFSYPGTEIPDDTFYELYDDYITSKQIELIFIDNHYEYTIFAKELFAKYIHYLSFPESTLIWFCKEQSNKQRYFFETKQWSEAIFSYDGGIFFEVFTTMSNKSIPLPYTKTDYPGSINCSGGLSINV